MAPRTIRSLRKKLGNLTQKQFAHKIGYATDTLAKWEQGALIPSRRAVDAMKFWKPKK